MSLREITRRTLTLVSCIPATWVAHRDAATDTVHDRFRMAVLLETIPDAGSARPIERRFAALFSGASASNRPTRPGRCGRPRSPTPPTSRPGSLLTVSTATSRPASPRRGRELDRLAPHDPHAPGPSPSPPGSRRESWPRWTRASPSWGTRRTWPAHRFDPTEDSMMPALLAAGLSAWIAEQGDAGAGVQPGPAAGRKPPCTRGCGEPGRGHRGRGALVLPGDRQSTPSPRSAGRASRLGGGGPGRRGPQAAAVPAAEPAGRGGRVPTAVLAASRARAAGCSGWADADLRILAALRGLFARAPVPSLQDVAGPAGSPPGDSNRAPRRPWARLVVPATRPSGPPSPADARTSLRPSPFRIGRDPGDTPRASAKPSTVLRRRRAHRGGAPHADPARVRRAGPSRWGRTVDRRQPLHVDLESLRSTPRSSPAPAPARPC